MPMSPSARKLGTAYKGDGFSSLRVIVLSLSAVLNSNKASCQVTILFMSQLLKDYKQQSWYWYHLQAV